MKKYDNGYANAHILYMFSRQNNERYGIHV